MENTRVAVVGGSRGLGLGIVEALRARKAQVTVVARDAARLGEVKEQLGVSVIPGDATDRAVARAVLRDVRPETVILSMGAGPAMAPIHEQTWEGFSEVWNQDVKATLFWIQEAIHQPLARGSRFLVVSSGAAIGGSPLSGGYAGAKRQQWLMAQYANGVAEELGLGIRFQVIVPMQIIGATDLGRRAAEAYARRLGRTMQEHLDKQFGKQLTPREFGEHVATVLAGPPTGTAFGIRADRGVWSLDG